MQIQCPACKTRAEIPDRQEGAKVRCGSCQRVYVARAPGTRNAAKQQSYGRAAALVGGVVLLSGVMAWLYHRGQSTAAETPVVDQEPVVETTAPVDYEGWNAEPVKTVRDLCAALQAFDKARVEKRISVPHVWAAQRTAAARAPGEGGETGETAEDAPTFGPQDFAALDNVARLLATDELVRGLLESEADDALRQWNPVDGRVLEEDDTQALIHVQVDKLDLSAGLESRTLAFRLVPDTQPGSRPGTWRVASWERFITPEEQRAQVARAAKDYAKVELSDGSKVYEAEPKPLEHLADTPPELRERIDLLYAKLIDLDLTTEATEARRELIAIGKPAIPILLTGLYEIPLDTLDQGIQVNNIVVALREITGERFSYAPMELAGSTTGTTQERRESAIKQWFAWWYRKGERFEGRAAPEEDPLEGLIELNEREKRLLERDRRSGG